MVADDSISADKYKTADEWILNHLVNATYNVKDTKGNSKEYRFADSRSPPPTQRRCVGCYITRKIPSADGTVCKVEDVEEVDKNPLPYVCSECYSPNLTLEAQLQENNEIAVEEQAQTQTLLSALEENRPGQTWQAADTPTEVDAVYEQTLNS